MMLHAKENKSADYPVSATWADFVLVINIFHIVIYAAL